MQIRGRWKRLTRAKGNVCEEYHFAVIPRRRRQRPHLQTHDLLPLMVTPARIYKAKDVINDKKEKKMRRTQKRNFFKLMQCKEEGSRLQNLEPEGSSLINQLGLLSFEDTIYYIIIIIYIYICLYMYVWTLPFTLLLVYLYGSILYSIIYSYLLKLSIYSLLYIPYVSIETHSLHLPTWIYAYIQI